MDFKIPVTTYKFVLPHSIAFQMLLGKLFKKHTLIYVLFMHLGLFICQELTLANRNPWLKNIFLSQYLFITILRVKMSHVNKAYV